MNRVIGHQVFLFMHSILSIVSVTEFHVGRLPKICTESETESDANDLDIPNNRCTNTTMYLNYCTSLVPYYCLFLIVIVCDSVSIENLKWLINQAYQFVKFLFTEFSTSMSIDRL